MHGKLAQTGPGAGRNYSAGPVKRPPIAVLLPVLLGGLFLGHGSTLVGADKVTGQLAASSTFGLPPVIVTQPVDLVLIFGQSATLDVTASGTMPFQYQWRLNGVNIPNETNRVLVLSAFALEQAGTYTVVVSNPYGVVQSDPALVRPVLPTVVAADDFEDRRPLTAAMPEFLSSNVGTGLERGEPMHAGKLGGRSVWFTLSTNAAGIATVRTTGSSFDTLLAVYLGTALDELEPEIADDDEGGFLGSAVRFNVVAGSKYVIAVDGLGGRSGDFIVSWEFERTLQTVPKIETHPATVVVLPGSAAVFNVVATGTGLTYQWYFQDKPIKFATNDSHTVIAAQPAHVGQYRVAITNAAGRGAVSDRAALELGPEPMAHSFSKFEDARLAGGFTQSAPLALSGSGVGAAASASLAGVNVVALSVGFANSQTFGNGLAFADLCQPCGVAGGSAQWFLFIIHESGQLTLDTTGTEFDTVMALYVDAANELELCDYVVTCDDNGAENGVHSRISVPVAHDTQYLVSISGAQGEQGNVTLAWSLCPAPSPIHYEGDTMILTGPTNPAPDPMNPQYAWWRDGVMVALTDEPFVPITPPMPEEGAPQFAVTYHRLIDGKSHPQTNQLGRILSADVALIALGGGTTFQILLSGLGETPFEIQQAVAPIPNCAGDWHWIAVHDYVAETVGESLRLTFQTDAPARFFRIRPPPYELDLP